MDPLTHTLVGASLSATRLGETTRRAVPALVIGANLPDIDVATMLISDDTALAFRRGWTHGVLAFIVLPALLAMALWLWDRWFSQGEPGVLSPGWLFALSYLAVLTHPALDWLNTYGIRLLMPFDDTWFYGDSVFIMDPWLWLVLGVGWLLGQRPRLWLFITWTIFTALLVLLVLLRAPSYAAAVGVVLLGLLMALVRRPPRRELTRKAAATGLVLSVLFIAGMVTLHEIAEGQVRNDLRRTGVRTTDQLMVGPLPMNPFVWEFVVSSEGRLRHGEFSFLSGREVLLSDFEQPDARASDLWNEIRSSGQIPGFLCWVRFPWIEFTADQDPTLLQILDARYARAAPAAFGSAPVDLAREDPTP